MLKYANFCLAGKNMCSNKMQNTLKSVSWLLFITKYYISMECRINYGQSLTSHTSYKPTFLFIGFRSLFLVTHV